MSTTKAGKGLIDTLPAYSDNFCRQNKKLLYSIVVKCYGKVNLYVYSSYLTVEGLTAQFPLIPLELSKLAIFWRSSVF